MATLIPISGDISLAEDAVQDVTAGRRWPVVGTPAKPAEWIVATARNRAIDLARRAARGRELQKQAHDDALRSAEADHELDDRPVRDDQLRLIEPLPSGKPTALKRHSRL